MPVSEAQGRAGVNGAHSLTASPGRQIVFIRGSPMKLLVTNDDGIDCIFLHELIFGLRARRHELAVVAPKTEQSWIGAAKSRMRPVRSEAADRGFGCPTWVVDGTPRTASTLRWLICLKCAPTPSSAG